MSTLTVSPEWSTPKGALCWTSAETGHWAVISDDQKYRYMLGRVIQERLSARTPRVSVFVMLNPSKADHHVSDPTITRCEDFAERMGSTLLIVVNLFAYRATDMKELERVKDPVGELNDWALDWPRRSALQRKSIPFDFIAAWGSASKLSATFRRNMVFPRHANAFDLFRPMPLMHLGLTAGDEPRHPLYLASTTKPEVWV